MVNKRNPPSSIAIPIRQKKIKKCFLAGFNREDHPFPILPIYGSCFLAGSNPEDHPVSYSYYTAAPILKTRMGI
jgi:hypothetical protein